MWLYNHLELLYGYHCMTNSIPYFPHAFLAIPCDIKKYNVLM